MHRFMQLVQPHSNVALSNYQSLHHWSIAKPKQFWNSLWRFTNLLPVLPPLPVTTPSSSSSSALIPSDDFFHFEFFPDKKINFAENMLRRPRSPSYCIHFSGEGSQQRSLTHNQLFLMTARIAAALKETDFVKRGDRVAAVVCNTPETVAAMLAVTAVGGVWCSCSPDFGVDGIVDRFNQIQPVVMFTTDYYLYKGKQHHCIQKAREVAQCLKSCRRVVVLPYAGVVSTADSAEERGGGGGGWTGGSLVTVVGEETVLEGAAE
eukprot:GHVS01074634.1.p1 GENE.GHVS01074634.1~~GHVS01074634.1.p1  ORF type:complete len:303 (-),score=76.62 GHVS01074634.1:23-811(-)